MTMYGYARVSSKDQNLNRQLDALSAVGVSEESVFVDHLSGRNFDRPGYRSLVERLQPGDVLVVKSIDRLGRNYDEILGQWRLLTKQRSIDIVVLDMPLLDTRSTSGHGVTGKLIADIVLELLSYVAHVERDNIRQRQAEAEGIAAARARGVKLGRPALAVPEEFDAVHRMWEDGSLNSRQAAESLGVSHTTFLKWVKQRPVDVTISHKSMRS
ncbi:recombinase family protein [Senegalimassilia anaerobia]|uniref:recombinase family protein n=1 Tax=Senegalimassilia anaerobia TaxID=1473216 RepID=UPI00265EEF71|nr:recombinase family protein [Senegalimassilia anaerobia]